MFGLETIYICRYELTEKNKCCMEETPKEFRQGKKSPYRYG